MANPYSSLKIFHHIEALDRIRNDEPIAPFYVRLKPTNLCNHHCSYCTYGSGGTNNRTNNRDSVDSLDTIPWTKLESILNDFVDIGVKAVTFSGGGEPLTYPHIVEAAGICSDNGIDLSLITNGQLLRDERAEAFRNAKWVRISFDSPVDVEYASIRGINETAFREVTQNIRSFSRIKSKSTVLGINYVVSQLNCDHVFEAARLVKELGADNIKFSAVIENKRDYHNAIKQSVVDQIHRAEDSLSDENFQIFNNYESDCEDKHFDGPGLAHCYTCRLVTVVGADQKIYLCHTRAYDSDAVVGDLSSDSFKEIWFSDETQSRLRAINPSLDCLNNCVYKNRNELIQAYYDADGEHVNFI